MVDWFVLLINHTTIFLHYSLNPMFPSPSVQLWCLQTPLPGIARRTSCILSQALMPLPRDSPASVPLLGHTLTS